MSLAVQTLCPPPQVIKQGMAMCAGGPIDCHLKLLVTPSEPHKTLMHGFKGRVSFFSLSSFIETIGGSMYNDSYYYNGRFY